MVLGFDENAFRLCDIAALVGGELNVPEKEALAFGVSIDSRTVKPGDIFFAIQGKNYDGNAYVDEALQKGAVCAVVSEKPMLPIPFLLVSDTKKALGLLARAYRRKFGAVTVAVTGSVGKTTTKQFIYSVLDTKYKTNKTDGNLNNDIGLPLTLFKLNASYKAMVVEMGMNHPGEIALLSRMAEPDISVITNIGTAHIENFGSREAICRAKLEIIDGMKEDGILILNGDEPLLRRFEARKLCKIYMGIENPNCQYNAVHIRRSGSGYLFDVDIRNGEDSITDLCIPVLGKHNIYNALAAVICGILLGVSEDDIRLGLTRYEAASMRTELENRGDFTIISDCYNASPESMEAALDVLDEVAKEKGGRKVAVLGEMCELGAMSRALHTRVGRAYAEADLLITLGKEAAAIGEGAREAGMDEKRIVSLPCGSDAETAGEIRALLRPGDTVLFKASRKIALENVIARI